MFGRRRLPAVIDVVNVYTSDMLIRQCRITGATQISIH